MKVIDYLPISGERRKPSTDEVFEVLSPHSENVVATVPAAATADVDAAVAAAQQAMVSPEWGQLEVKERLAVVERFAEVYARRAGDLAEAMTTEMGCPVSLVRMMHVDPAVVAFRYYLDLASDYAFEEHRHWARSTIVRRRPVGVVAAIIPWNGPVFLTAVKLAPALVSGCAMVLKPPPEAPLSSYVLAEIAEEAALPAGVLNVVVADREVSEYLVVHPGVRKVSFTGSSQGGRRVAELCGRNLKPVGLELGGKSAAIVLDDAELALTVDTLRMATFANSGQVCTARTRVLVPWQRYDEMVEALGTMADSLQVGDPTDPTTDLGPLISAHQRDRVLDYIRIGTEEGARLVAGGSAPDEPAHGYYVRPTVFADVRNDMRIAREEIFGPVMSVIGYEDEDEAIDIANDSDFGLSGSVFTSDVDHGVAVARRAYTGTFGVNTFGNGIDAPFGGVRASGLGREMGPEGLEEYFEYQSVLLPKDS
jgi:aldehyde dehydrogenase (NAD+)